MTDQQVLGMRGQRDANGTPIEYAMSRNLMDQNAAFLAKKGYEPNGANVYLAHFVGAGGADKVLSADPRTPLTALLDPGAIKANPHIANMTAGDLRQWTANTVDRMAGAGGGNNAPMAIGSQPGGLPAMAQPNITGSRLGAAQGDDNTLARLMGYNTQQPLGLGTNMLNPDVRAAAAAETATPAYQMPTANTQAQPAAQQPAAQQPATQQPVTQQPPQFANKTTAAINTAKNAEEVNDITKAQQAREVLKAVKYNPETGGSIVDDLIKQSTSGALQNVGSGLYGAVTGSATSGKEAIAKLETIGSSVVMSAMGGKLGAGVSNADRDFVEQQFGVIADSNRPMNARLAAWQAVKERMAERAGADAPPASTAPGVTPTGRQPVSDRIAPPKRVDFNSW